jgi:hypothetical protein
MMKNKLSWTFKLSIFGLILIILNFILIGGGYGFFKILYFCFPFPCLLMMNLDKLNPIIIILLFLQFPIYGCVIDKYNNRFKYVGLIVFVFHLIFAIIALQNVPSGFK